MTRQPVRNVGAPAARQPQAAPVNTYVRPPDPAPSPLHDLARGLAVFDSGLSGFLEKRQVEQDKADAIRGAAAFNRNNQVGWAEAVKSGAVPANSSPMFVESYKKAQGNVLGIKLREDYNRAYQAWPGKNSEDPAAFDQFLTEFISTNLGGTEDPYILGGLLPHVNALTDDAYSKYNEDQSTLVYDGSVSTRGALAGDTIDHASNQGLANEQGTDYGLLMDDLLEQRQEAMASGIRMADYDKQLVDSIVDKAIEHGDPQLLDLLDEVPPGYDVKLSSLPEFRDRKSDAIDKLELEARRRALDAQDRREREDELRENAIITTVMDVLSQDPTVDIPEDIVKEWQKYDPMAPTKLVDIREKLLIGKTTEDPLDLLTIERRIQEGATVQDIMDLVADGTIQDVTTMRSAIDRIEKRKKSAQSGSGILNGQTSKRFLSTIKERTAPDPIVGSLLAPEGLTDEGLEASRDFEEMLLEWELVNPDASLIERERAINEIGDLILKRIDVDQRQYISEQDAIDQVRQERLDAEQAQRESQAPAAEEASSEQPRTGLTGPLGDIPEAFRKTVDGAIGGIGRTLFGSQDERDQVSPFTGDQPPDINTLPPEVQAQMESGAEELGMTKEEYTMEFWKSLREKIGLDPSGQSGGTNTVPTGTASEPKASQITFVEPTTNPSVSLEALAKFSGGKVPVALRNNNMGAISITGDVGSSWAAKQPGFLGTTDRPSSEGGKYAKYATPEHGVAAAARLLQRYGELGVNTPSTIVKKWSTDKKAHAAYARTLVKFLKQDGFKVGTNTPLDLSEPMTLKAVLKAQSHFETGAGVPIYQDSVFETGVAMAGSTTTPSESAKDVLENTFGSDTVEGKVVQLGYAAETSDIKSGIGAAIDAALNPANGSKATNLEVASKYLGLSERNSKQASTLSAFIRKTAGISVDPASTAWCAAFANAVLGEQGVEGTGTLVARDFMEWGQEAAKPTKGDVVVFWRESPTSWKGHVAFFDGYVTKNGKKYVRVLGGNQSDSVRFSEYPVDEVLGYRRPEKLTINV